jgi:hypothetical protein
LVVGWQHLDDSLSVVESETIGLDCGPMDDVFSSAR